MSPEEFSKLFLRFAGPFLMVMSPLYGFLLVRAYLRDSAKGIPLPHIGWIIFGILLVGGGTVFGFFYCRKEYGWFGGKKTK